MLFAFSGFPPPFFVVRTKYNNCPLMCCCTLLCVFFAECHPNSLSCNVGGTRQSKHACFALIGTPFPLLPLFPYENSVVHPYSQRHRAEGAGGFPATRQHVADACKFILFLFFSFGNIYKKNKSTFVRPYDLHL